MKIFAEEKKELSSIFDFYEHWQKKLVKLSRFYLAVNFCPVLEKIENRRKLLSAKIFIQHWKYFRKGVERVDQKVYFNTNCKLSQICTEKQIMAFKTTVNWLFNDILVICWLFWLKNWHFSTESFKGLNFILLSVLTKYNNLSLWRF